jgi:hypothetical protein
VDATAWVAIAGIAGTLVGALLAPIIAEKMRRKSARLERMAGERLEVYAELLRVTARIADNMLGWKAAPRAELKETDTEEFDRLTSRLHVVGSKDVYDKFEDLRSKLGPFYGLHYLIRQSLTPGFQNEYGTKQNIATQRAELAQKADDIIQNHNDLLTIIRAEFDS